ncbi:hypothetical protein RFI_04757 [Reticulomyxa filosa]|uniref:Kelch motif family protein n=1 Tax=Reticulomyxa filosa TaxID=46433 RepID=X6P1D3_RETFI|nr:hypothetical protein RFI_04757 [Reticulomyxa filosa]|eukprot:ETO32360.1 hypothetical protein RFI_04757 [Reticulomyxa filosa]
MNSIDDNSVTPFLSLPDLPVPLHQSQCVTHKDEILICGGFLSQDCYSYHMLKKKYKLICRYPEDVTLKGHCVVKRTDNNNPNDITLLSFGGGAKHSLVLRYVSVWNDDSGNKIDGINTENTKHCNEWLPFTDNNGQPICLGRMYDNYWGASALIGGSNNHLLFITYRLNNIAVFDLNLFRYIKYDKLPMHNEICYHCFVSKAINRLELNKNKRKHEMLLFCQDKGFSIEYDEDDNNFKFNEVWVCSTIRPFYAYAYVCINDFILFFGGHTTDDDCSKDVHKFSMTTNKWRKFEHTLPSPLYACFGTLSRDNTFVHIIGGKYDKKNVSALHIKANVKEWMREETEIEKQWIMIEKEKQEIHEIKMEMEKTYYNLAQKKIKV